MVSDRNSSPRPGSKVLSLGGEIRYQPLHLEGNDYDYIYKIGDTLHNKGDMKVGRRQKEGPESLRRQPS